MEVKSCRQLFSVVFPNDDDISVKQHVPNNYLGIALKNKVPLTQSIEKQTYTIKILSIEKKTTYESGQTKLTATKLLYMCFISLLELTTYFSHQNHYASDVTELDIEFKEFLTDRGNGGSFLPFTAPIVRSSELDIQSVDSFNGGRLVFQEGVEGDSMTG